MKNKKVIGAAIIAGGIIAAQNGCAPTNSRDKNKQQTSQNNNMKAEKEKLTQRLKKLAKEKNTTQVSISAMCYEPVVRKPAEYICPVCTNKTKNENFSDFDLRRIESIRNKVMEIKKLSYDAELDESEYCEHCRKDKNITEPSLIFKIRFSENEDYHVVKSNIEDNYECLLQFLLNKKTYEDSFGNEYYIGDERNVDIIVKMTGLEP